MSDFISLVEKSQGDTSLGEYSEDIHWCDDEPCDGIWLDPVTLPDESIITPN